ncbi:hypothetical protein UlMin_010799 [Ulmus minor]
MLEQLRDYLMCRMATKREVVAKWIQPLGPRIIKIIENNKQLARLCHAKRFQLTGIPCGHALACIFARNYNVYDYINSFYKKEAYEKTYAPVIYPMQHPDRWPNARQHVILPLIFKKMPSKPKKLKTREPGEPLASNAPPTKARRFNMVMHCRNCKQPSHYYTFSKEATTITFHLTNHYFIKDKSNKPIFCHYSHSRKKVNADEATISHQPSTQPRTRNSSTPNAGAQSSTLM